MPRTAGVSSSVARRLSLFRPRPISVACWRSLRRAGLLTCSTVTVFLVSVFTIAFASFGSALLGHRFAVAPARHDIAHLLAAPRRHRARAGLALQRVESGSHHIVGVRRAKRLGDHI